MCVCLYDLVCVCVCVCMSTQIFLLLGVIGWVELFGVSVDVRVLAGMNVVLRGASEASQYEPRAGVCVCVCVCVCDLASVASNMNGTSEASQYERGRCVCVCVCVYLCVCVCVCDLVSVACNMKGASEASLGAGLCVCV